MPITFVRTVADNVVFILPLRLRMAHAAGIYRRERLSLAITYSRAMIGIQATCVTIEAHISNGLPALTLVGLPETTVKEARDRVRSALLNAGLTFPAKRITVNLAPADLPKEGGRYDLPIALSILAASYSDLWQGVSAV